MEPKIIHCKWCNKYMGEIWSAKLRKDLVFICEPCEKKALEHQKDAEEESDILERLLYNK